MGSPSRTRLQSWRHFSWWGPSLPWLLQPQRLSLSPRLMLILGTATDTVATDGAATTGPMATMATMEKGPQMPSQNPLLPLTLTLMLMLGMDTMVTATVAGDTAATTGPMATMATTERGPQMRSLSPLLLLSPMLMLIPGMATDTVATDGVATTDLMATMATTERGLQLRSLMLTLIPGTATDTVAMDGAATTDLMATMAGDTAATIAHMDMEVTGEVTGAKQTNRGVDSSSDCDFLSTLASISRACA